MKIKVNCYNLVILQGKIKSIESKQNAGKALTRLLLITGNYTASVYCYALLAGSRLLKEGSYITVIGKLRYSTDSKGYKIIATELYHAHEGAQFSLVTIEGYFFGEQFKHFSANKGGEVYMLPLKVVFDTGKKERTEELIKEDKPYILEGLMQYDVDSKLSIKGRHIRCTKPVEMEA